MPASVYAPVPLPAFKLEDELDSQSLPAAQGDVHILHDSNEEDRDDSSIHTIDALMRRRARQYPDAHVVSYPSSGIEFVDYTLKQLDIFAWRTAKYYEGNLPPRASSADKPTVVALLGPSNLEYLVTMLALTKLGHTVLLLSTRIPQIAIESLLEATGAKALIAENRHMQIASQVQETMPSLQLLNIVQRESFEFPIEVQGDTRLDYHLDPNAETNNIAWIIHSSGSTGLPKPIYQTHKSCLPNYAMSMDMRAFITLPLFHNHGICNFFRAIHSCKSIHLYNADLPLTKDYLISIMQKHRFEIFYGVPYALKLLSESEEGIELLRQLRTVMYGGSACPDDLGNLLVHSGVNLVGHYGATEVGQLMTSFRPPGDTAWNYVREHERLKPYLKWIPQGPNLFECSVTEGWPAKVQANQPDGSYRTKDLFEPHPTIPGAWKYIARLDDTLVLVNGEKFSPVALEGVIRSNRNVAEAVVYGAGRPYLGILVVPAPSLADRPHEEVLDTIWNVVKSANQNVDSFARIAKGMVRILPTDCSYPRTDKGSIIRQAFYKAFQDDINESYDEQDTAADGDLQSFSLPEMRTFVRRILAETVSETTDTENIQDDTDFFLLGLDSLQALQMRTQIIKTVNLGQGRKLLGQNVVFEHPSIEKMSSFLYALSRGELETKSTAIESEMQALIEKHGDISSGRQGSVVITGATGSLGAHTVSQLCADPNVTTIYCLVRASDSHAALQRVKSSLIQRKVYHSLPLSSRRKIVALPSDLADPKLGLSNELYNTLCRNLRSVIHCAWSVNFNMQLSSFESNITGVKNLITLCKRSEGTATMNFCSSVSTCSRSDVLPVPESAPALEWAQSMGYAQSKSVSEHICAAAARQGVKARVLRVGQIIGDTQHGVWNAQEAVPMMMQTAVTIGALPKLPEMLSWLPVDTVASAIIDIALSETTDGFFNVTHPKTISFIEKLLPSLRACGLEFEEVEPKEWIQRLRASNPDPRVNAPIKLVDFFASKYDKTEFSPSKAFATDAACSLSPALANAPVLGPDLVKKFVNYFSQTAWKTSTAAADAVTAPKTAIFMAGPCGTGKTTMGKATADWLQVPFIEGDSLHSKPAIDKMRSRSPLSTEDRLAWLTRLSRHAAEALEDLDFSNVVLSCSALKRSYRSQLRTSLADRNIQVLFIDLQAEGEVLLDRVAKRKGHYMSEDMVEGQLQTYEVASNEEVDVLPVDAVHEMDSVLAEVKWLLSNAGVGVTI